MTCDDLKVPRPATGKTPVRNARIPDEVWLPAIARAELEGRSASDAMTEAMRAYIAQPVPASFGFTYANWPGARDWAADYSVALETLGIDLEYQFPETITDEAVAVIAWHAVTRHESDPDQQTRMIAGHIMGLFLRETSWRTEYRDARHLLNTVREIVGRHIPLRHDAKGG